jgi:putative transposase
MEIDPRLPRRGNPAAGVHIYPGQPTIVFLTVATRHRSSWLADPLVHRLLIEDWNEAEAWIVGHYLLMPDHLHLFCAPVHLQISIERWIAFWKSVFRSKHDRADWKFQSRGWHHRLRREESYQDKWRYVQENPVRDNLVSRSCDWPYQGTIHQLPW